jgi:hypothetical protein
MRFWQYGKRAEKKRVHFKLSRKVSKNLYLCANQTNKKLCDMSKEEFLSIAEGYYADFESLKESSNFYDYEKSFVELMQKLNCDFMEKQLNEGSVTHNRRKKKL